MLRVVSDPVGREVARYRVTAFPVAFGSGFYEEERDDVAVFRWMGLAGELHIESTDTDRFLEIWLFSSFRDLSQELSMRGGQWRQTRVLPHGWSRLSVSIPPGLERLQLGVNKLFPKSFYPEDSRELAIRLRRGAFTHEDAERHRHIKSQYANRIHNWQEMLEGKVRLDSTPATLGIDMYGVCNVKPPCVYCDWDTSKAMEGDLVEAPFTSETLESWGEIFAGAHNLVNCSIGEPFMMKNLDELFDVYGDRGKALEMTTNGQILTERNIEKLLDREIDLYISLDAATPETYARLRNDTLERILANLRRLIAAKGGRDGLPRVHLVFMPMKCNVHEMEAFIELCAEMDVDRLVLRPLNYSDAISLKWEREGYVFNYPEELLPFEELIRLSARAAHLCAELNVPLSDQLDFGVAMEEKFAEEFKADAAVPDSDPAAEAIHASPARETTAESEVLQAAVESLGEERLPACMEPWTSLYILRRGVLPCCYGGHPIADMDGHGDAWNSEIIQEIRSELAAGRFHVYCLRSPSCPIVRKDSHAGDLPRSQAIYLRCREFMQRLDRRFFGIPGKIYRPTKWESMRLWAMVTDSSYLKGHLQRWWNRSRGKEAARLD